MALWKPPTMQLLKSTTDATTVSHWTSLLLVLQNGSINQDMHSTMTTLIKYLYRLSCKTFLHGFLTGDKEDRNNVTWGVYGIPPWPLTGTEVHFCEVCRLAQLILVMTATNAVSE